MTTPPKNTVPDSFRESLIASAELNECDKIDLHLLGHIQGETAHVIFLQYPELKVVAVDERIVSVPFVRPQNNKMSSSADESSAPSTACDDFKADALLGDNLSDWLPQPILQRVQGVIKEMIQCSSMRGYAVFAESGCFYTVCVSSTDKCDFSTIGIEIESVDDESASMSLNSTLLFLGRGMELQGNGEDAAIASCDILFDLLSTYERGMVYRFNDDLSGEVIHETMRDEAIQPTYLGLRFPASDIPQSSRQLYIKNGVRYIRDSDATDVPVIALDGEKPVDLTQTRARSCHKAHIIYMKNMGVVCSMSIAIVVDGELWVRAELLSNSGNYCFELPIIAALAC